MVKSLRLLALVLVVSGCPSPVRSLTLQQCAEACGDSGVESVTSMECRCQSKPEMPATVPLDPIGC